MERNYLQIPAKTKKNGSFERSEKLDQGLIDATNKRAELDRKKLQRRNRNMKENKITWQNYKNRKKMLA